MSLGWLPDKKADARGSLSASAQWVGRSGSKAARLLKQYFASTHALGVVSAVRVARHPPRKNFGRWRRECCGAVSAQTFDGCPSLHRARSPQEEVRG